MGWHPLLLGEQSLFIFITVQGHGVGGAYHKSHRVRDGYTCTGFDPSQSSVCLSQTFELYTALGCVLVSAAEKES